MASKKNPIDSVSYHREQLLSAIRTAYKASPRERAEIAAVLCVIRIQQLIVELRDHH